MRADVDTTINVLKVIIIVTGLPSIVWLNSVVASLIKTEDRGYGVETFL